MIITNETTKHGGAYLLLINYGSEGWQIMRYSNTEALVAAVKDGQSYGNEFVVAKELNLQVREEKNA